MEESLPQSTSRVSERTQSNNKMSILAMSQPTTHSAFKRHYAWEDSRQSDFASRHRNEPERIALPSIRQAFPELSLRISSAESNARASSSTTSPVVGLGSGAISPSDYVHSPSSNKRRRLSAGDESDERISQVPRLYSSRDSLPVGSMLSPSPMSSRNDGWASSNRRTSYVQQSEGLPPMRSPPLVEIERTTSRPAAVSNLPFLNIEPQSVPAPRVRGHSTDEGYPRAILSRQNAPEMEPIAPPGFRPGGYEFPGHHPARGHSLSLSSIHAFDQRAAFPAAEYGPQYQDYMRVGEQGGMGVNGDNKQRKRRGNLPKETTDKLRAWFMAHLQHPYPTEDEKQDLMRQTGLQMNQISNWFINARRRQLPTMINNARAESDAMAAGRSAEGKILPSTERVEYGHGSQGGSVSLSDHDGSAYEDDVDSPKHPHGLSMKRGSV